MNSFSSRLLKWYRKNARRLPWRGSADPYTVWVSEIMLQQTQVETVIPYFERWMARFPTVEALAAASGQEALSAWEGLGYYGRARNLHRAAQIVVAEHDGKLPCDVKALRKLPGVGRYTAGALASLICGLDEPVLDGNVRRVLSRVCNVREFADSPAGEKKLWALAAGFLPHGRAADYNQALMELGALVCTPRKPDCPRCPLRDLCQAHARGVQHERPVMKPRSKTPHLTVTAAVIRSNGRVLLARRPPEGLLGGLWEFPGGKVEAGETLEEGLCREIREELGAAIRVGEPFGVYRHAYTHFRFTLHAFLCHLVNGEPRPLEDNEIYWATPGELAQFPMGKVDRQIARKITADGSR